MARTQRHAIRAALRTVKTRELREERRAHRRLGTGPLADLPDDLPDKPCGYQLAPELHVYKADRLTTEILRLPDGTLAGTVAGPAGAITGTPKALVHYAEHLVLIAAAASYAQQLDDWNGTIEGLTP